MPRFCRPSSRGTFRPELLEARIAPAVLNPIPDLIPARGDTSTTIDLTELLDPNVTSPHRTFVTFQTNFDTDPNTPGIQLDNDPNTPGNQGSVIVFELFDDVAPLTVNNFLKYALSTDPSSTYEGTYFHRTDLSLGVLQGGGFIAKDLREHIETGPTLHNEYSDARPNVRGTISMAKTGLGPNTGTSEWFINLDDNSQSLGGNNNGGFTVFGQVVTGLDLVDKISNLDTASIISGFNTPVQNLPEGRTPKPDQVIQITDVTSVKSSDTTGTNPAGRTFEVVVPTGSFYTTSIDPANDMDPAKTILTINYMAGQFGVADLEVRILENGVPIDSDTFKVTLRPNLVAEIVTESLQTVIIPGDTASTTVKIGNSGGAVTTGAYTVNIYLSRINGTNADGSRPDSDGRLVNDTDILVATMQTNLSLEGGDETEIKIPINISSALVNVNTDVYRFIAEVKPAAGNLNQDLFTDDDVAINGNLHAYANGFGDVTVQTASGSASRQNAVLTYVESDGTVVTLSTRGSGGGVLVPVGEDLAGGADLSLVNTDASTQLLIKAKGGSDNGRMAVRNLDSSGFVGTINLPFADVSGYVALSGGVRNLTLGNINSNSTFVIGGGTFTNDTGAIIKLGQVKDVYFESATPIRSLSVVDWQDTTGRKDTLLAASLAKLTVTGQKAKGTLPAILGDFEADIIVGGAARVGSISVAGTISDSDIRLGSGIGTLSAAGMVDSSLFIGEDTAGTNSVSSIKINLVQDSQIESEEGIRTIAVQEWLDESSEKDAITTPFLGKLSVTGKKASGTTAAIRGDFEADLTVTGETTVSSISVTGFFSDATIQSSAGIKAITLGGMQNAAVFIGTDGRPDELGDFSGDLSLGKFMIKGIKDFSGDLFSDSQIAAQRIASIVLRDVDATNDGEKFGVTADRVDSYQRTDSNDSDNKTSLKNLDSRGERDVQGDYRVNIL